MDLQRFNLLDQILKGWEDLDDWLLDDLLNFNRLDKILHLIRTQSPSENYEIRDLFIQPKYDWSWVDGIYPTTNVAASTLILKRVMKSIRIRDDGPLVDLSSEETRQRRLALIMQTIPEGSRSLWARNKSELHRGSEYKFTNDLKTFLREGAGSFFLKRDPQSSSEGTESWIVDLRDLEVYETRPDFERYGGCLTYHKELSTGYEQLGIEYGGLSYYMGSPGYERVEHIFRASMCLKIILEYHAILCHIIGAQFMAYDYLNRGHELTGRERLLLSLMLHRSLEINSKIVVLAGSKGSLFHRAFGLTHEAQKRFIQDAIQRYRSMSHEQLRDFLVGTEGTMWYQKATQFYWICVDFIGRALPGAYIPTQRWINFAFITWFMHELMGDQQLFHIGVNNFLPTRVRKNSWRMDTRRHLDILATATTAVSTRVPLLLPVERASNSESLFPAVECNLDASSSRLPKDRVVANFLEQDAGLIQCWRNLTDRISREFKNDEFIDVENLEISVGY